MQPHNEFHRNMSAFAHEILTPWDFHRRFSLCRRIAMFCNYNEVSICVVITFYFSNWPVGPVLWTVTHFHKPLWRWRFSAATNRVVPPFICSTDLPLKPLILEHMRHIRCSLPNEFIQTFCYQTHIYRCRKPALQFDTAMYYISDNWLTDWLTDLLLWAQVRISQFRNLFASLQIASSKHFRNSSEIAVSSAHVQSC